LNPHFHLGVVQGFKSAKTRRRSSGHHDHEEIGFYLSRL
jgi:hypothetical protein